jgi:uncharacterized OsmC-like protein
MDIRSLQRPLKEPYRQDPASSRITLTATGLQLGALADCAQITCQMVAAAMGIPTEGIEVTVEGDLDLRGTVGISKETQVGFESIRVIFDVRAPEATEKQLSALRAKTEQHCRGDANLAASAED